MVSEQKLLCSACKGVRRLNLDSAKGIYLRSAWTEEGVKCSGKTSADQKKSLRRKIFDHKNPSSHLAAVKLSDTAHEDILPGTILQTKLNLVSTTARLMRTANSLAKHNRPFTAYTELCDLQEANGVNLGKALHSRYSAASMIDCISTSMYQKLCPAIANNGNKISIRMDESITVSRKSCLVAR